MKNLLLAISHGAFIFSIFLGLTSCNAQNPALQERPELQTTISADGQMIAVLKNAYTDKMFVRFKRLDQPHEWENLPVPPYTNSIRFGLTGHELLLTYQKNAEGTASELVKWDLDAYQKTKTEPVLIYSSTGLGFPIEVTPNEYLVRTCPPTPEDKCHRYFWNWHFIYKNGNVHKYRESDRYDFPNIVPTQGFFWREHTANDKDLPHPLIRSRAFPNKTTPSFDTSQLDMTTQNIRCDYKIERCLRTFVIKPKTPGPAYVYDVEILYGKQRCAIQGVSGWSDGESITPDGNSAVMGLGKPDSTEPHRVVVMRFKAQQCEPVSVEHIHF